MQCILCSRQSRSHGASQFWWQKGPQDNKESHRQLNKRALFPVHVLEYSDDGIQAISGQALPPQAESPLAAEPQSSSKEAVLHGRGVVSMTAASQAGTLCTCADILQHILETHAHARAAHALLPHVS